MDYTEALFTQLDYGVRNLWASVKSMPEDKLDWQPAELARSARQVLEEAVDMFAANAKSIANVQFDMEGNWDGDKKQRTLEELEAEHMAGVEAYKAAVKGFPVDRLGEVLDLPWGRMSWLDVIYYPYWNLMYHWGQINYIQLMYGDKDMA